MVGHFAGHVGEVVECLYPKHGRRNILVRQRGAVVASGINKQGKAYITIDRGAHGGFRTLSLSKVVGLEFPDLN